MTTAVLGTASAQAATPVHVGVVGGYDTWYYAGTCSSGGHNCAAAQFRQASACPSGTQGRDGTYDDVTVRFYATTGWGCA